MAGLSPIAPPRQDQTVIHYLTALHSVAELLCAIARDWSRSAGEDLGRVLDGDPADHQAATEALEAAQDAHGKAMALLFAVELRLARVRAAQADADARVGAGPPHERVA